VKHTDVINFWFEEIDSSHWFKKSDEFDEEIKTRFGYLFEEISRGEHYKWRDSSEGRLAEVIVLDQFSRNMFRNDAKSFSKDCLALALAQEAVFHNYDKNLEPRKRGFLYMPYMHSESVIVHEEAIRLFTDLGNEDQLKYEMLHYEIIKKFGRYPHRNEILGRSSTKEEIEFLKQKGSSF